MKLSQLLFTALSFVLSSSALADIDCSGQVQKDLTQVTVHITNLGKIGATQSGYVHIAYANGSMEDYLISQDDVSQYFEGSRSPSTDQVMVGLEAYTNINDPISINYVGTNYDKAPLISVLETVGRVKEPGNTMIVWRGNGYKSNEQFYFEDVVCSVVLNP